MNCHVPCNIISDDLHSGSRNAYRAIKLSGCVAVVIHALGQLPVGQYTNTGHSQLPIGSDCLDGQYENVAVADISMNDTLLIRTPVPY